MIFPALDLGFYDRLTDAEKLEFRDLLQMADQEGRTELWSILRHAMNGGRDEHGSWDFFDVARVVEAIGCLRRSEGSVWDPDSALVTEACDFFKRVFLDRAMTVMRASDRAAYPELYA